MSDPRDALYASVRELGPSATLAINELSNQLRGQGRTIYKFGLGQSPFPVPEFVVQALRDRAAEKDYLPVAGYAPLREQVAAYHNALDGVSLGADDIVVGPGSKELMFLLQLVFDGETLIGSPGWVSYVPQAQILRREITHLHTSFESRWRVTPQLLDEHCSGATRPRILILNYPGNPDGLSYTPEELQGITEVARRHGVIVLSDEIYGRLDHHGEHQSIASLYPEGTIISGGLSKWCGAGGWRLGTFAFSPQLEWLRKAVIAVASETYTSVSAPIQHGAVRGFQLGDDIDDYLHHSRRVLRAVGKHCTDGLRSTGARLHDPTGAFYLYPDFEPIRERLEARGISDGATLCRRLLEDTGVAILPGAAFGRVGELTARLAYVNFDGDAALKASADSPQGELGEQFLADHCPEVVSGMKALQIWLGDSTV